VPSAAVARFFAWRGSFLASAAFAPNSRSLASISVHSAASMRAAFSSRPGWGAAHICACAEQRDRHNEEQAKHHRRGEAERHRERREQRAGVARNPK
jgi:hypothetical protein